jgi:ribonuclease J
MKNALEIIPLGGVAEIGSNMTLLKFNNQQVILDIGILFPYEDFFGINYLIPDFTALDFSTDTILFITHGHEDHIGAIEHILQVNPRIQIYAPPFAAALIQAKIKYRNLNITPRITVYNDGFELNFDTFNLVPIRVNHSIPDTFGVTLTNKKLSLGMLFISDFKIDTENYFENAFDPKILAQVFSQLENTYYLIDSTNILVNNKTASEKDLIPHLEKLISSDTRIFITLFASNIHRIKTILQLCRKHKRRPIAVGRSIINYTNIAYQTGHLCPVQDKYFELEQVNNLEDTKNLFIVSGCQGDFFSNMRRIALNEHNKLKIKSNDLVIFSSKAIPGNEKIIFRMINSLIDLGAEVITANDYLVHASGHPGQEDLKLLLSEFKPKYYIPIHGESYFLKKHCDFINKNYPQINPIAIRNADTVQILDDGSYQLKKGQQTAPLIIHGKSLLLEKTQVSERRKLATQGLIVVGLTKKEINLKTLGLPLIFEQQRDHLIELINKMPKQNEQDKEEIRILLRQYSNSILGYKPIVIVL